MSSSTGGRGGAWTLVTIAFILDAFAGATAGPMEGVFFLPPTPLAGGIEAGPKVGGATLPWTMWFPCLFLLMAAAGGVGAAAEAVAGAGGRSGDDGGGTISA